MELKQETEERKARNKRWWKSISTSATSSAFYLSPGATAAYALIAILTTMVMGACFPILALLSSWIFLGLAGVATTLFVVLLPFFAPRELYRHYTAERYEDWKRWKTNKHESDVEVNANADADINPNPTPNANLLDLSYAAYLKDKDYEFGFIAYLSRIVDLVAEHWGKTILVLVAMLISALLVASGIGFFSGEVFGELMRPFIEGMTSVFALLFDEQTAQIFAIVVASLLPLVIADAIRRILETWDEADKHADNKKYDPTLPEDNTYVAMKLSAGASSTFSGIFGKSELSEKILSNEARIQALEKKQQVTKDKVLKSSVVGDAPITEKDMMNSQSAPFPTGGSDVLDSTNIEFHEQESETKSSASKVL